VRRVSGTCRLHFFLVSVAKRRTTAQPPCQAIRVPSQGHPLGLAAAAVHEEGDEIPDMGREGEKEFLFVGVVEVADPVNFAPEPFQRPTGGVYLPLVPGLIDDGAEEGVRAIGAGGLEGARLLLPWQDPGLGDELVAPSGDIVLADFGKQGLLSEAA
jgi:hypothetical protein